MKNLKSEKGAITIVVLASMLFLLAFLMSAYMIVANKAKKQKEISQEIQEMYSKHEDLEETYNKYINNDVIPIYTVEQLLKIGSQEDLLIDNKYCKMTWDATYALMNDLVITENWTPINSNPNFIGNFIGNGHIVTVKVNNVSTVYSNVNNFRNNLNSMLDIKVGDYISNYDPTPVYNNGTSYKVAAILAGTGGDQAFTEDETLGWRVLSIDKTTGEIELIADKATSTGLTLDGATGWNNSINIINDTCKSIYSKEGVGEARSINVEDINTISGYTPTTGSTYQASNYGSNNYFPLEYLKEKGISENTFTNTDKTNGYRTNTTIRVTNTDYSYKPEEQTEYTASAGLINIGTTYWLASRCVSARSGYANFCVHCVDSRGRVSSSDLWWSENEARPSYVRLRPVVTLMSNVQLEKDEIATTAEKTYWKIK